MCAVAARAPLCAREDSKGLGCREVAIARSLLLELHHDMLNELSDHCDAHFLGLRQAAHRVRGQLSSRMLRQIRAVYVAASMMRHITRPAGRTLLAELRTQVANGGG